MIEVDCSVYKKSDTNTPKFTYGCVESIKDDIATVILISESTWVNRYTANVSDLVVDVNCYHCVLKNGGV